MPGYYTETDLECDFWYRLLDIRRLVADDTAVVIAKLKTLRNTGYNDRPVSLYGGMVDLPLIVVRAGRTSDVLRSRATADRCRTTGSGPRSTPRPVGVGAMERELRENLFGDDAWLALDPAARTFIASAEKILRDQRTDPAFDFGPVVANLAKALEVTCNAILRAVAHRIPEHLRTVRVGTDTLKLGTSGHLTTGQLAHVLRGKTPAAPAAPSAARERRLVRRCLPGGTQPGRGLEEPRRTPGPRLP